MLSCLLLLAQLGLQLIQLSLQALDLLLALTSLGLECLRSQSKKGNSGYSTQTHWPALAAQLHSTSGSFSQDPLAPHGYSPKYSTQNNHTLLPRPPVDTLLTTRWL